MDFNWTSIPSVNKRVFCNKSRIKTTLFVVYLMQKQFTKDEEKAVLYSTSVNEPTETVPKWRIFCEKGWEADRSMGSRYQKKTNTSHQSARVRFHPGNGFLCLSPVHIDSCLSFPDISILLTPPASLIWGCLLLVMEKNSQRGGPPVRWSLLELGGEGGPAKFPAAAPRCPSQDAPGGDPSVWAAHGLIWRV